ncbi:MAG TPA: GDSL-type esterase/lipase family protein [Polyangia bacterium]|jgi:lysophospholipase L1-like esterase|nr:GDSL-type esterase/lipase family protein [Polyangia bacterium]
MSSIRLLLIVAVAVIGSTRAAHAQIKVACVGDSITVGTGSTAGNDYPSVLGRLLGSAWQVRNFGNGGKTMMKMPADPPADSYWLQPTFPASKAYAPAVVVIMLGTNDSKTVNWRGGSNQYDADYRAMVGEYQALPSMPKVFVVLPPPAIKSTHTIDGAVIQNQIVPIVRKIAADIRGVSLIDVFGAFQPMPAQYLTDDGVHPNDKGYALLAQTVFKALTATNPDGGVDSGVDSGTTGDAGTDAHETGGVDAGAEANETGAVDAGAEANETGAVDAGVEADETGTVDAGVEADETGTVDAGVDADETGGVDAPIDVEEIGGVDAGVGADETGATEAPVEAGPPEAGAPDGGEASDAVIGDVEMDAMEDDPHAAGGAALLAAGASIHSDRAGGSDARTDGGNRDAAARSHSGDGGCSCRAVGSTSASWLVLLVALGLMVDARRSAGRRR